MKSLRTHACTVFVLLGILLACPMAFSTAAIELPDWNPPAKVEGTPFKIGGQADTIHIWGRGSGWVEPVFFDDRLPAIFTRTLVVDEYKFPKGGLRWLFTGELGGVTVWLERNRLALYQRFNDSHGHFTYEEGKFKVDKRMPEKRTVSTELNFDGKIKSISLTMDSRLGVSVSLNGKQMLQQTCMLDLLHHQLQLSSRESIMRGKLIKPKPIEVSVKLDSNEKRQTMIGWGGIVTPLAYRELSKEGKQRWWELISEYNLLVQREYPIGTRLLEDMSNWDDPKWGVPHYYGDNFPNSEISDFDYIKQIRKLGGEVWFEFWALPDWANKTWLDADGNPKKNSRGKTIKIADPKIYAKIMLNYCQTSLEKTGAPPEVVGIQNECWQPTEIWYAMTRSLRRELDKAGFEKVKIHMTDSSSLKGGIERAEIFTANKEIWNMIDYSATHMYDYQGYFTNPDGFDERLQRWHSLTKDRPCLSTELCINSICWQIQSYRIAFQMGQLYHKNLALADTAAISYCWILLNVEQPSFGWTRTLFVPDPAHGFVPKASSHQLRVYGAYSRRIKRDMVRIGATASHPDMLATAFQGKGGDTVVLLNRSTAPQIVSIEGVKKGFKWLERTDQYNENAVVKVKMKPRNGIVKVEVAPGSIVTLSSEPLGKLPRGFKID
jgi:hypothetical protein